MKIFGNYLIFDKKWVSYKTKYKKALNVLPVKSSGECWIKTQKTDFYGLQCNAVLLFEDDKLLEVKLQIEDYSFTKTCRTLDDHFNSKKKDDGRRYFTKKMHIDVMPEGVTITSRKASLYATPFNKGLKYVSNLVDKTTLTAFVTVLLIGLYMTYDTAYVFYNSSSSVSPFKVFAEKEKVNQELTEGYVAWLNFPDTSIDYPVMQGKTNSEFLNKNPYGEYSLSGSIFLDSRLSYDFSDSYCLIYGHHMSNNYMFGALDLYYDEEYFKQHSVGTLKVGDITYRLDVFALADDDANTYVIFDPEGSRDLLTYLKNTAKIYYTPINNHILGMSTCKDPGSTARTIVFATMTPIEVEEEVKELTPEEIVKQQLEKEREEMEQQQSEGVEE